MFDEQDEQTLTDHFLKKFIMSTEGNISFFNGGYTIYYLYSFYNSFYHASLSKIYV